MDLKIKDVAELLHVSEKTILKWISTKKIPSYQINQQYLFNRNEIEDWVLKQQENPSHPFLDANPDFANPNLDPIGIASGGIKQFSLYRALHKGKILFKIPGDKKEEILRNASRDIAPLLNLDSDVLGDLLLERENLHSTSLGQGMALPHARELLLTNHHDIVVIAFPEKLIEYGALDGAPVHTLIFLFACDDKRHLNLIAKIAHLSHLPATLPLLRKQPSKELILDYVKNWEALLGTISC
jgi:PTS system nitrogen regulatory IIA component